MSKIEVLEMGFSFDIVRVVFRGIICLENEFLEL